MQLPNGRRLTPSTVALVVANAGPLAGVLFLKWEVFPVLLLFWIENVTMGVMNVLKMICAPPGSRARWLFKLLLVPFFCVHYGIFCAVHGAFVVGLFGGGFDSSELFATDIVFRCIREQHLAWAIAGLVGSHLFSFVYNYLWLGEYRQADLDTLMAQPYGRVVVLHLTVIFGGFLVMSTRSSMAALVLLVVLKTGFDLRAHLKERRKFGQTTVVGLASQPI